MKLILVYSYILTLIISTCVGLVNYHRLDKAMRTVVFYLIVQLLSEILMYVTGEFEQYTLRTGITNIYISVNIFVVTQFFIHVSNTNKSSLLTIANLVIWATITLLNTAYLQPFSEINSNVLLYGSFTTITMCLYLIYSFIKRDDVLVLYHNPHFKIAMLWLVMWSSTMFFWATIKVLFRNHWVHTELIMHIHELINVLVCIGIGATIFFYQRKKFSIENI